MRGVIHFLTITALVSSNVNGLALQQPPQPRPASTTNTATNSINEPIFGVSGRRKALQSVVAAGAFLTFGTVSTVHPVSALDMDAFANAQIEADKKACNPKLDPKCAPKMTEAEALCKYGQSGNARAEACKKFKQQGGELPSVSKEKSLGGAYAI